MTINPSLLHAFCNIAQSFFHIFYVLQNINYLNQIIFIFET